MTQLFSQWFNCLGATCPKETLAIILTGFRPSFHKHAPYFERPWSNFDLDFQWAAFLAFDAEGSQAFYVGWNPFVAGPRALFFLMRIPFAGGRFKSQHFLHARVFQLPLTTSLAQDLLWKKVEPLQCSTGLQP